MGGVGRGGIRPRMSLPILPEFPAGPLPRVRFDVAPRPSDPIDRGSRLLSIPAIETPSRPISFPRREFNR